MTFGHKNSILNAKNGGQTKYLDKPLYGTMRLMEIKEIVLSIKFGFLSIILFKTSGVVLKCVLKILENSQKHKWRNSFWVTLG